MPEYGKALRLLRNTKGSDGPVRTNYHIAKHIPNLTFFLQTIRKPRITGATFGGTNRRDTEPRPQIPCSFQVVSGAHTAGY